jgi:HD-GYP domain-containing protein (c-di-GMP phosphodiesterase class II)
MKRHCEVGYRIALASPELAPIADWILRHQEWWNGAGYPLGLAKEEIPRPCRMLAIVDAYDAMTHDRPYRRAMTHADAVTELAGCAGRQFAPDLVKLFLRIIEPPAPS